MAIDDDGDPLNDAETYTRPGYRVPQRVIIIIITRSYYRKESAASPRLPSHTHVKHP